MGNGRGKHGIDPHRHETRTNGTTGGTIDTVNAWLGDPTNVLVAALAILAASLVPVCARITAVHARSRRGGGSVRSHLLKAEGQRVRSVAGGMERLDRVQIYHGRLRLLREERHRSVRRRQISVLLLAFFALALLVLSFVAPLPRWMGLLPLVGIVALLIEGAISTRREQEAEAALRAKARMAGRSVLRAPSVTAPLDLPAPRPSAADGPQSRPIRSMRQVAHAVPLTGQARRKAIADATPSIPVARAHRARRRIPPERKAPEEEPSDARHVVRE